MKKLLIPLAGVVVLVTGLIVVVSLQPDSFAVERSIDIAQPPAKVFPHVNDLQAWDAWTPWKELDPNATTSISRPSAGKGATFHWSGNDQIGEGTLTILESKPDKLVEVEQAFVRPFEGNANMAFTFAPSADGTRLAWKIYGKNNFLAKFMCMFMDMDAMLGGDFERGLGNMKAVIEKGDAPNQEAAS